VSRRTGEEIRRVATLILPENLIRRKLFEGRASLCLDRPPAAGLGTEIHAPEDIRNDLCVPLDRNQKARLLHRARCLMRATEKGRHYGPVTAKCYAALCALDWLPQQQVRPLLPQL
jgi:hypothetical protein